MNGMALLPVQASSNAATVDALFWTMFGLCAFVATCVFVVMIWYAVRYRVASNASREREPQPQRKRDNRRLEWAWTLTPLALFLGIFVWAADLYADLYDVPPDALQISVVAKQWMWKLQHPGGQREVNELHVPVGRAVRLTMTSQDVIHDFFVPAFRVKHDVLPGRYTTLWFRPTKTGEFHLFCAELCGTDHSMMRGRIVVMQPAEYARWLERGDPVGLAARGAADFRQFGCSGCHGDSATVHAPKLQGLFGKPVPLSGGGTVVFDERYIHDSILLPRKEVAAGYEPIMPSFEGRISEEQILEIVAYLKSLGPDDRIAQ